jgi:ribA/ribD-fused uncharacterized protein
MKPNEALTEIFKIVDHPDLKSGVPPDQVDSILARIRHLCGTAEGNYHGLDTDKRVCFYEQEFYCLSNFSSFKVKWKDVLYDTSEAAYHSEKFNFFPHIQEELRDAISAHECYKIAQFYKKYQRVDWDDVKTDIMHEILCAKVKQHEYVRQKLLETGERQLVENSWRDNFWGWGPEGKGLNVLGKLWMIVRTRVNNGEL